MLYHDEPIFPNGELAGRTTSGMWSYVESRCLALGYLGNPDGVSKAWLEAGEYEIEVAGARITATASLRPFYAPRTRGV